MKTQNEVGNRYGYLIVLSITSRPEKLKSKGVYWLCKCDCGNETVKSTRILRSYRETINCGCKNDMVMDLAGKRFGKLLVTSRDQSYQYKGCYNTHWLCICDCGSGTSVSSSALKRGETKSCGCYRVDFGKAKVGENSPFWKGGRVLKDGYVCLRNTSHPNSSKSGYVKEHTFVMSQHLGRPLVKGELIHHKDGNRQNNNLSNLELCRFGQPPGQRVDDLVKYAWDIIDKYDPEHKRLTNYSNS